MLHIANLAMKAALIDVEICDVIERLTSKEDPANEQLPG
jgi:hypothetical protein